MKVCWVSAPPYATTGYGKQTNEIVTRLLDRGIDVECIGGGTEAIWGGKILIGTPKGNLLCVRPTMGRIGGGDVVGHYIRKFHYDFCITLWDSFVVNWAKEVGIPVAHYIPIDAPFTSRMQSYIADAYKVIAYSKFGYKELVKWFPLNQIDYIPHGIDTEVYKFTSTEDRKVTRANLYPGPVPEDAFLFLTVGANVGERKQLPNLMIAFKRLLERTRRKDLYLFMYTNVGSDYPHGYDLTKFADDLGILPYVRCPDFNTILEPWEDVDMARLYSASDVYVSPTLGEGFGLPVLEALSCSLPVIATNCSTQPELVGDAGWLINTIDDKYQFVPVWIPTLQVYPVADMEHLLKLMEFAVSERNGELKEMSAKARQRAILYDWDKAGIIDLWLEFLRKAEEEMKFYDEIK